MKGGVLRVASIVLFVLAVGLILRDPPASTVEATGATLARWGPAVIAAGLGVWAWRRSSSS